MAVLSGCGGGGSGLSFIPPPVSTPTPTGPSTPTPTGPSTPASGYAKIAVFPAVTTDTNFAAIGIEASRPGTSPTTFTTNGFSVRYDAASALYLVTVPTTSGGLYEYKGDSPNSRYWNGSLLDGGGNWQAEATVLKPANPELQLRYTSLIHYNASGMSPEPYGWLAFATPTGAGAIPVSGNATYSALVRGSSIDGNGWIQGSSTLQFDFAAGQLAGHFDPTYVSLGGIGDEVALGRYDFKDTVYGVGSVTFSGLMHNPSFAQDGSFSGQFTGPGAEELMSNWTAPFRSPDTGKDSTMFGVWVGKKP